MDEDKKNKVLIGVIVGCLVLAAIITVVTNRGDGRGSRGSTGPITMLCINDQCNADFELSIDELKEQMEGFNEFLMDNPIYICPECNKRSAYRSIICSQCDTIFVPVQNNDYRDRCPECGYSKSEERRNAAK